MEVNGIYNCSGYPHSSKYLILCLAKLLLIEFWNNLRVSMMTEYTFNVKMCFYNIA